MNKNIYKLILVTNRGNTPLSKYLDFIRICAESGVTAVQLREKNASSEFLFEFGSKLVGLLTPLKIPLIINDHINLAAQINAEGTHLGQTDGDPRQARTILGKDKIIGLSIETSEQLEQAYHFPVNYVAASAVFPTQNKQHIKRIWGLGGLSEFVKQSKHPVVAIGGINIQNAKDVMRTGVAGLAIMGAIHKATNPSITTRAFRQVVDQHIREATHV